MFSTFIIAWCVSSETEKRDNGSIADHGQYRCKSALALPVPLGGPQRPANCADSARPIQDKKVAYLS